MTPLPRTRDFRHVRSLSTAPGPGLPLRALAVALAGAGLLAPGAHAQTAEPGPTVLDPVTVTGTRVEKRAFDIPQSITTLRAEELQSAGPQINLSEALSRVPGLTVNNRNNYAQDLQMSSRGFGARSSFGVRGLRLYTDGIPATMPDGSGQVSHFDLANAQRIEVLRGPFSALYGNSSGGVIALFTAPAREPYFKLEGQVGNHNTGLLRTSVGAPIGEALDLQANWSDFRTGGFRPQSTAERHNLNVRLGWKGEHDRLTLLAGTMDQPAEDPLGLTRAQFEADPYQAAPVATQFNTRKVLSQDQAGLNWQHQFQGAGALQDSQVVVYRGKRSVTQWQAIPVATQAPPRHPGGVIDFDRTYDGIDGRLSWRWEQARLVAGVDVERQQDDRRGFENYTGTGPTQVLGVTGKLRRDEDNRATSRDAYAQGEYDFAPDWTASAGVRSGRIKLSTRDSYLGNGDDSGDMSFSYTNPAVGVRWKLQPNWNLYASAGRGFEAPTLTELAYRPDGSSGFNTALKAQTSRQFEIGSKWRDPEAGFGLEAAVFQAETSNELGVQTNAGGRSTFQNVGHTRRRGAEVAGRWDPRSDWRAQVALTWLDARYRDDFLTCAAVPCPSPTVTVPSGNRIAGTSPRSAFAEVAWRPLAWAGTELGVEMRAQGRLTANDTNTESAGGYSVFAARLSHAFVLDSRTALDVFARVDNLTDKVYAGSVVVNDSNQRHFETGQPRTWLLGARLNARW